jgi:hypothetical protein
MSKCNACGRVITFRPTRHDKQQPLNPDGTVHFATCTGKPLRRKPSAHTAKQQPELIEGYAGCANRCANGWVRVEGDGKSGVVPCPIHRKSA